MAADMPTFPNGKQLVGLVLTFPPTFFKEVEHFTPTKGLVRGRTTNQLIHQWHAPSPSKLTDNTCAAASSDREITAPFYSCLKTGTVLMPVKHKIEIQISQPRDHSFYLPENAVVGYCSPTILRQVMVQDCNPHSVLVSRVEHLCCFLQLCFANVALLTGEPAL